MIGPAWNYLRHSISRISAAIAPRPRRRRRNYQSASLHAEWLEPRQLLSANEIRFDAATSAIVIEGTAGADSARVWNDTSSNIRVSLESASGTKYSSFLSSDVELVQFIAGDGDDGFTNLTALRTWAWGGTGRDHFIGGSGENYLFGGSDDDRLVGNAGSNILLGEDGNDKLISGTGSNLLLGGSGNDELYGAGGRDLLHGEAGNDYLVGDAGNDRMWGGSGDDNMVGSAGDDEIYGEDGNDLIDGQDGNDAVYGGAGKDVLRGGTGNNTLSGGVDDDELYGGGFDDLLHGDDGNDYLVGDAGDDRMWGGLGDDNMVGSAGDDELDGDGGNDQVHGQDGNDRASGGEGNDIVTGGGGDNFLLGGSGNDELYGGSGHDSLYGDAGNDYLAGGSGNDSVWGGTGDDNLVGGEGQDYLNGSDGNDQIDGQDGSDFVFGEAGDDVLRGGTGSNILFGGAGDDELYGGETHDLLHGDDGNDYVVGDGGNDALWGGRGYDNLVGSAGDDELHGDEDIDEVHGQDGNDVVLGGAGDDVVTGGEGRDIVFGGLGTDILYGQGGDDILMGAVSGYDADSFRLRELALAWSVAAPYGTRIQQIENEQFIARIQSEESVSDDQAKDDIFGGDGQDWFILTGFLGYYKPASEHEHDQSHDAEPADPAAPHQHAAIVIDELPLLEGFEFIDALDHLVNPDTSESIHSLVPHVSSLTLQREHLSLFELVRYDQVTHIAHHDGAWSDPATWLGGVVPTAGARVLIPIGVEVRVDSVLSTRLATIRVDGTLTFDATRNSELRVDTIVVTGAGAFVMGTPEQPIQSGVTARLLFTDNGAINRTWDPFGISRGLISHGKISIHGAAVTSYAAMLTPPIAGATALILKSIPIGWKVGDTIVVAGTTGGAAQNEARVIAAMIGNMVVLDRALAFSHLPPTSDLEVHVAHLTRNAVIESESVTAARRGHVMFMHDRDVNVSNAGFYRLGRTDKSVLINDSIVDSLWRLKPGSGTNNRARYPVHFHRNGLTKDGNPSVIRGSVVLDSPGWGFVNHSSYVDMINNVAFNVRGSAFATEVGDEIGGFYGNLAIGSTGTHEEINSREYLYQDFGHEGNGFWFQGAGVSVVGNISAGHQSHAFVFYTRGLVEGTVRGVFPTANLTDPTIGNGEKAIAVDLVPMSNFTGNIGYSAAFGLTIRYHLRDAPHQQYSVFENSKFWNNTVGAVLAYSHNTVLRNLTVVQAPKPGLTNGILTGLVEANIQFENLTIAGYFTGLTMPWQGYNIVRGGNFNNDRDILIHSAALTDRHILITGALNQPRIVLYAELPKLGKNTVDVYFVNDVVELDFGTLNNHVLYHPLRAANEVPFPNSADGIPPQYVGLTNQQLWARFGVALGGKVAPSHVFTAPFIDALIAPLI